MKIKKGLALICACTLLLTMMSGSLSVQADSTAATMTDGTVAYLNSNQENAYATPHGNYSVIDIANDSYAHAWLRISGISHFGAVPTYGYGFDSQAADYATSNTGVYYRMEAGLTAEVSFQYHHTYGVNSYNKVKLYWSTDEKTWTELTNAKYTEPIKANDSANHRVIVYSADLPTKAQAGSDVVYLDVRFPTESLTANSAAYVRGGFHIGAVKTFKKATMTDGTVSYLDANQENAYATPHGNYSVIDIANDSYAHAWLRISGISHFGAVPTYGYGFDSQAADYATSNTGVYYRMEAGLTAERFPSNIIIPTESTAIIRLSFIGQQTKKTGQSLQTLNIQNRLKQMIALITV